MRYADCGVHNVFPLWKHLHKESSGTLNIQKPVVLGFCWMSLLLLTTHLKIKNIIILGSAMHINNGQQYKQDLLVPNCCRLQPDSVNQQSIIQLDSDSFLVTYIAMVIKSILLNFLHYTFTHD